MKEVAISVIFNMISLFNRFITIKVSMFDYL